MRAVIQRVSEACVEIDTSSVAQIRKGIVLFVGFEPADSTADFRYICEKVCHLRIFEDDNGKMNHSLEDVGAEILLVPNFTLFGDARKGRRPSYSNSSDPATAAIQFAAFQEVLSKCSCFVRSGIFRASMKVRLTNDGPVTILLDSRKNF